MRFVADSVHHGATLWAPTKVGSVVAVLVRRRHEQDFERLLPDGIVEIGDEVARYEIDRSDEASLRALNATYTAEHYVGVPPGPWSDEAAAIDAHVPHAGAWVLEVCCGAGRLGGALLRDGNHVVALDISVTCVRHAVAHDPSDVAYIAGNALALPFCDRAFDVAGVFDSSLGVLFSDKARAVDELVRVAKQRVVLGLRDAGDETLHVYHSPTGQVEVAETFTFSSVMQLLGALSPASRARIARRQFSSGEERPWGGRMFFVVLHLGADTP